MLVFNTIFLEGKEINIILVFQSHFEVISCFSNSYDKLEVLLKMQKTFHKYCFNVHIIPVLDCCSALFFL